MIFQGDAFQLIADIVAAILNFLKPIVSPMGSFMVNWIEAVLQFFPRDSLTLYITLFVIIVLLGGIANVAWAGDKKPKFLVVLYSFICITLPS